MKREQAVRVLYVEDDAIDVDFAQMAFKETNCRDIDLHIVSDGEEAVEYLGMEGGKSKKCSRPDVVLLDLNIPKIHGKDVLRMIKNSSQLKDIPVIILSTSHNQPEVDETRLLGAAEYFKKPAGYVAYKEVFKIICDKWIKNAR